MANVSKGDIPNNEVKVPDSPAPDRCAANEGRTPHHIGCRATGEAQPALASLPGGPTAPV